ncbi:hypothetical protein DFP72DRAFT_974406, partial [Ephemerocybe angulata]
MSAKRSSGSAVRAAREPSVYHVGDVVLGKVRGYAPWPGIVSNPDNVPENVKADRPANKKATFYCIRFFPNNEYSWLLEKDISRLQPHEIEAYITEPTKKKAKPDLLEAYRIAQDPTAWLAKMDALAAQALAAASASDAAASDEDAEADDVDELESDAVAASASTKSKKRKRDAVEGGAKAKKAPKTSTSTSTASAKKGKTASTKGRGKNGAKSKAMVESEDEGEHGPSASGAEDEDAVGPSAKKTKKASAAKEPKEAGEGSPPPTKRQKRVNAAAAAAAEKEAEESNHDPEAVQVRDWRHKLQKMFLGKVLPKDEGMPEIDELFRTVEAKEDITIEQLQFSKIGKVMRHIAALPAGKVPRDAEFRFRERARALVERWQAILTKSKEGESKGGSPAKEEEGKEK